MTIQISLLSSTNPRPSTTTSMYFLFPLIQFAEIFTLKSKFLQNYDMRSKDIDLIVRPKSHRRAKNRVNQQFKGLKIDIVGTLIPLVIVFLFMIVKFLFTQLSSKGFIIVLEHRATSRINALYRRHCRPQCRTK